MSNLEMLPYPNRQDYDTKEGIEKYVRDGLAGLHRLQSHRHTAGYERGERLNDWIVLGAFRLDACGNFCPITAGAPADFYQEDAELPAVMTPAEASVYSKRSVVTYQAALPPTHDLCPRCRYGWTISNVRDFVFPSTVSGRESRQAFHERCYQYHIDDLSRRQFTRIAESAGLKYFWLDAIPNEYGSGAWRGPWYLLRLENRNGHIRLGWRKSVISIDWSESFDYVDGLKLFAGEDVTKEQNLIHAWGEEKAIEYLKKLDQNLIKP